MKSHILFRPAAPLPYRSQAPTRTDSNYLTEDMAQTATDLVAALLPVLPFVRGAELVPEIGRVINSAKDRKSTRLNSSHKH